MIVLVTDYTPLDSSPLASSSDPFAGTDFPRAAFARYVWMVSIDPSVPLPGDSATWLQPGKTMRLCGLKVASGIGTSSLRGSMSNDDDDATGAWIIPITEDDSQSQTLIESVPIPLRPSRPRC